MPRQNASRFDDHEGQEVDRNDPTTIIGAAFRFANSQSPIALIALAALGFLAWLYVSKIESIGADMHDHAQTSAFYQRQICVSLAGLAGTPPSFCEPQANDDRSGR